MFYSLIPGEEVLPEKLYEGAVAASQNPCTLYDQNLQFSVPYLRPDQKPNTLVMTVAACTVALSIRAFVDCLIDTGDDETVACSEKHT